MQDFSMEFLYRYIFFCILEKKIFKNMIMVLFYIYYLYIVLCHYLYYVLPERSS